MSRWANFCLPHAFGACASALRHSCLVTLMLMAPGDRAGRVPGSLDALDLLVHLARGRAEPVDADLVVRHTGAQRAYLGCGIVLRSAEAECLVLQLDEIRLDLGSSLRTLDRWRYGKGQPCCDAGRHRRHSWFTHAHRQRKDNCRRKRRPLVMARKRKTLARFHKRNSAFVSASLPPSTFWK